MNDIILELGNLSLGYGSKCIFGGIGASVRSGDLIALCGANGVGKSTLLRTIAGLEPVFSGKLFLSGIDYRELRHKRIAEQVAFVPSLPARARNLSVGEMLATNCYFRTGILGNIGRRDKELISEALEEVSLGGFEDRDSYSLSDGEYQRVAIAGAIVKDGGVIVLDEPSAFLDAANKVLVTDLLKQIAHDRGKAVIFSTHDIPLALDYCDRMWLMCADGSFYDKTPQETISSGVLDKIFKISDLKYDPLRHAFRKVR